MAGCAGKHCDVIEISIKLLPPFAVAGNCPADLPQPKESTIETYLIEEEKKHLAPSGCGKDSGCEDKECPCIKIEGAMPVSIQQKKERTVKIPGGHGEPCVWEITVKYVLTTTTTPGLCGSSC